MDPERSPLAGAACAHTVEAGHRPVPDPMENAMKLRQVTASLVALAAVAGPLAACGGSNPSERSAKSGGPGSVSIADFKFAPASLTAGAGARISIANHDGTAHTVTADDGHSFDTGDIDPNASATVTLSKPGTYKYHCSIHPFMHGTFVVK
jgi:plastocyanin